MNDPNAFTGGRPRTANDLVGQILSDRYRVSRLLGEGGMGSVYLGEHITLRKRVAIKVLHHDLCRDPTQVDRFLQEARAASMIGHENIVDIVDFGPVPDGSVYFAMEFLEGEDLAELLKREGRLRWSRARELMLQIIRALRAAHGKGIIHRDLKPANCFLVKRSDGRDFVKLLDFGIAKVTDPESGNGSGLTRTGAVFGTAKYMAPEQACGEPADQRTDIYAAAICLYEFLTGQVPYDGDNFMRVLSRHLTEPLTRPSVMAPEANIPSLVEAIIVRALEKRPDDRYQSMAEFEEAILSLDAAGNLVGHYAAHAPHHAPLTPPLLQQEARGSTVWLPQTGQRPASQPDRGGGTVLLDDIQVPAPPPELRQSGPHGWAARSSGHSAPEGTFVLDHGFPPSEGPGYPPELQGRPSSQPEARGPRGPASSVPPGSVPRGGHSYAPASAEARSPDRRQGPSGPEYTVFMTDEPRSSSKFMLLLGLGGVVAVVAGVALALWLTSSDGEIEETPPTAEKADASPKTKVIPASAVPSDDDPGPVLEKLPVAVAPVLEEKPPAPVLEEKPPAPVLEPTPTTPVEKPPVVEPVRPTITRPSTPKAPKTPKAALDAHDLKRGFTKANAAVHACKGALPGMKRTVRATINAEGTVLGVTVLTTPALPVDSCVKDAVKKHARFVETTKLDSKDWTFTF